eukprot:s1524_g12.t1
MRLKRLCTPTAKGKLHVSQEVAEQWQEGNREELQLALVKALKQHGYENNYATLTAVRARFVETNFQFLCGTPKKEHTGISYPWQGEFSKQMLKLKEMKSQREEELEGGWYTEERMERDLGYSKSLACNLTKVAPWILLNYFISK